MKTEFHVGQNVIVENDKISASARIAEILEDNYYAVAMPPTAPGVFPRKVFHASQITAFPKGELFVVHEPHSST